LKEERGPTRSGSKAWGCEKAKQSEDWNLSRHRNCDTLTTHHV